MYGKSMSPRIQQQMLLDPRYALAQELAKSGSSTAPVSTPLEGIARMLQGGLAGYQQHQIQSDYENRDKTASDTLAKALEAYSGKPAQTDLPGPNMDGTAGYSTPEVKPDMQMAAKILMGNPDTADAGMGMFTKAIDEKMKASQPIKMGAGDILLDPKTGKPIYTAPAKAQWEQSIDPKLGQIQRNVITGEIKPIPTKPKTESQAKADTFSARMLEANKKIEQNAAAGLDMGQKVKSGIPLIGNYLVSDQYQSLDQAKRDFVNAVLRNESGAAINQGEFDNAEKQYFPQPGDSKATIAQKAKNRQIAIAMMQKAAGEGDGALPNDMPSTGGIKFLGFE